ncbi:hypothetical protein PoB_000131200 [Plakobranchus ocellatus]|uniref:Uncharacterized protein n=1 Tax=Plakobranchus ocellatus TaxID=259542 RepID=A0AAV3XWH6_9GAST|nr:hypothetical protein PoB_000131200 [Plakobranchus ocellatus]
MPETKLCPAFQYSISLRSPKEPFLKGYVFTYSYMNGRNPSFLELGGLQDVVPSGPCGPWPHVGDEDGGVGDGGADGGAVPQGAPQEAPGGNSRAANPLGNGTSYPPSPWGQRNLLA